MMEPCKGCQALRWDDCDHKWRCEMGCAQRLEPAWWPTPLVSCPRPATVKESEEAAQIDEEPPDDE